MSEVSHSQSESSLKPKNPKMASKFSAILRIVHMRHLEMRLFFFKTPQKKPQPYYQQQWEGFVDERMFSTIHL